MTEVEPKTHLSKSSKALEKLTSIVFDPKFISNLGYHTKFRHTGSVENFNSMLTKYAPKRNAFDYRYFIGRIALAAIDHNMHAHRAIAKTNMGGFATRGVTTRVPENIELNPLESARITNTFLTVLQR